MRLIVSGGGTGGHIYPAVAIAKGLEAASPGSKVLYIGTAQGMESRIVPEQGLEFRGIQARGWQGRRLSSLAGALKVNAAGQKEAASLIADFKPDAVLGTGGYVCLPVALAARQAGAAVYIHEQNAWPGLANRLISLWAQKIMLSFDEARDRFPRPVRHKALRTGLPVRPEIISADREQAREALGLAAGVPVLLAVGGSQGARSVNQAMLHVIRALYGRRDVQVVLAAGRRDYQEISEVLAAEGLLCQGEKNIFLFPYIDRMEWALAAADLYVGRAGASTLAELTVRGLPAILIPYPFASANHQTWNARSLADRGAAVLLEDSQLTGPRLLEAAEHLLQDPEALGAMGEKSLACAKPRALEEILSLLLG